MEEPVELCETEGEQKLNSQGLGIRIQKKLLGKMSSKKIAKHFIDDVAGKILDDLHRIAKTHSGKKEADKVTKNAIKTTIKLGILYRNDKLSAEELRTADQFKHKFHTTAMTLCSFYEVDFTYDRQHLIALLDECRSLIHALIRRHLTDKSADRVDHVFDYFCRPSFLDALFQQGGALWVMLGRVVKNLHILMDRGDL